MERQHYMSDPRHAGRSSYENTHLVKNKFISILQKERKLLIFVFLFIAVWINVYNLFFFKPKFAAESMVMIKDSAITHQYVQDNLQQTIQTTSNPASNDVLNTMNLLKTDIIGDSLWNFMRAKYPGELKDRQIENYRDWKLFFKEGASFIKSKNITGTDLITVTFSWADPVVAKKGLDTILSAFQEASLNINRMEQSNREQYLTGKVTDIADKLAAVRLQISKYKDNLKASDIQEYSTDVTKAITDLQNQLNAKEAGAKSREAEYHRYEQMLGMSTQDAMDASRIGQNANLTALQEKLYSLEQQKQLLDATLTEHNPEVQQVNAQIDEVRQNIEIELKKTLGHVVSLNPDNVKVMGDLARGDVLSHLASAQAEAKSLSVEAAVLRQRLSEIEHEVPILNQGEKDLAKLQAQERFLSAELDKLHEKLMEARLKEADTLSNVFIVNPPTVPLKPKFPNHPQLGILGVLLGILTGALAVYGKHRVRQFLNPREVPVYTNGYHSSLEDSSDILAESSSRNN